MPHAAGVLAVFAMAAVAQENPVPANAQGSPADTLASSATLICEPAIRHFCRNIHVGCSGRSDIRARPFALFVEGQDARLDFTGGAPADVPSTGPVLTGDGYVLVRLRPEADYVKVKANGRYSFRLYRRGVAFMSYGKCRGPS